MKFHMECGCILEKKETKKLNNRHRECIYHKDGFIKFKTGECSECGTIVYQHNPRVKVAAMCPKCTKEHRLEKARITSKRIYKEKQDAIGLEVNHHDGFVKGDYKFPIGSLSLTQAIIRCVPTIPLQSLFDFRQSMHDQI